MKQRVSETTRQQVIDLRRRHSLREVAAATGLPLGTVKTLVSRSGVFRDNTNHHALFTLPPIRENGETLPSVPALPPQEAVTGDKEVDAAIWLRSVIATGQAALIETALKAAKKIKTPLEVLEKRYTQHLIAANPGNVFATFASFGFADLESLAASAIEKHRLQAEGAARFGDELLAATDAEIFCIETLAGLDSSIISYDKDEVAERFKACPELRPHTLADCLHELDYWHRLYRLRKAAGQFAGDGEGPPEATSREWFVFGLMAEIRPRNRDEAKAVFRHLMYGDRRDSDEAEAILDNLIG